MSRDMALIIGTIDEYQEELLPGEHLLSEGVTNRRLRELKAGRASARRAIECLNGQPVEILTNSQGAPVTSPQYCVSLSHTNRYVSALVGLRSRFESVGVDIDDERPLGEAAIDVAFLNEIKLLKEAFPMKGEDAIACLVFSMKEAVFKCQCPLTGDRSLDFLDIEIVSGKSSNTFQFRVLDTVARATLAHLSKRTIIFFVEQDGLIATCATV